MPFLPQAEDTEKAPTYEANLLDKASLYQGKLAAPSPWTPGIWEDFAGSS